MRKRLLASVLGVALALTMAVPAMAAESVNFGKFTVNGEVTEVRMLEEEDYLGTYRKYLVVCPEGVTITASQDNEGTLDLYFVDDYVGKLLKDEFTSWFKQLKASETSDPLSDGKYYCVNVPIEGQGDTFMDDLVDSLHHIEVYFSIGKGVHEEYKDAKVVYGGGGDGQGQQTGGEPQALARSQTIQVDGKDVTFQTYALKDSQGNETNYVKLRDVASVLNGSAAQFNVAWDGAINLQTKTAYTPDGSEMSTPFSGDRPYTVNTSPIKIDGTAAEMEAITLTDASGGYTYFKLRDLGKALGFNVSWDGAIKVNTAEPYSDAQ